MKIPTLDPPLNLAGLSIMGMAEKGMNNPLPETEMNERAGRMQESIQDYQQAMNPTDDGTLAPGRAKMNVPRRPPCKKER